MCKFFRAGILPALFSLLGVNSVSESFKVFLLSSEFYSICDWGNYKIPIKQNRPVLILAIEDSTNPDIVNCIPISKDDDKNDKYKNLSASKPDLVHPLDDINHYDNYLLIQNMFYLRKEFIGAPFIVDGSHSEIKKEALKRAITKKVKKLDALFKRGSLKGFVPRQEVYDLQLQYLEKKEKEKEKEKLAVLTP